MKNLNRDTKISLICHGVFFAVLISLFAVASFFDLRISQALSNGDSFFGAFFAVAGEWPAYLILPLCSVSLFYNARLIEGKKGFVFMAISALLCFAGILIWCVNGEKLVEVPHKWAFGVVYSFLGTAVLLWLGKFVNESAIKKSFRFAVFAICVMLVSFIIINLLKLCWGRMRFRDMLAAGSFEGFTPWYSPNGIRRGGDFTSFPSGHTSSAANIFVITALPSVFGWKRADAKYWLYGFCTLFTVLTALARVVYNAHFLSDTLAGGAISYAVFYAFNRLFFKRTGGVKDEQ